MNDKQARAFIIAVVIALIAYWAMKNRPVQNATLIEPTAQGGTTVLPVDPMTQYFAANPQLFVPQSQSIDITIGNQAINYLNNSVIPMFGFVGMAQGNVYQ